MKIIISFTLLFWLLLPISMKSDNQIVRVWTLDGNCIDYKFEDKLVTSYSDEELVLETKDFIVKYPLTNLHKFTYVEMLVTQNSESVNKKEPISQEDLDNKINSIQYISNILYFRHLTPYSKISIFSETGVLMFNGGTDATGYLQISIEKFNRGIYVVKTEKETFKIVKI